MIGAQLEREPVLFVSGIVYIPEGKATAVVVLIFLLEDLHPSDVLLIARDIRIGKGIVLHSASVDDGLGDALSAVLDGLRGIARVEITRY